MDYGHMLAFHMERDADMTVGCVEVPVMEARGFGVMAVNEQGKVERFEEKPENPSTMPGSDSIALASMGIYVFNTQFLYEALIRDAHNPDSDNDFGRNIIPEAIEKSRVYAYPFRDPNTGEQGFWRDVGTVDSFWAANMELVDPMPELNLYDKEWPIRTYQPQLPSAKFVLDEGQQQGEVVNSIVSGGCIISAASLRRSLLFSNVRVHARSVLEETVVFPEVEIGRDCHIRRAVIDAGCRIPDGTVIGANQDDDARRFNVSNNGIVAVTVEMLGQSRSSIV
jgi:glucose-1-phosphate adenylyltransferase